MLSKIISHEVYLSINLVHLCFVKLTIVKRLSEGFHPPICWRNHVVLCAGPSTGRSEVSDGSGRPVHLAYQPPANRTFLLEQTSHKQSANSTFLSEQISTGHQPPAKQTDCPTSQYSIYYISMLIAD
jgi:hypothetical protein